MKDRGQWGTRTGFVLAAVGSAIGLGNIWRFPYTTASNGGGAFLIAYIVALLTAGIPIMILEFGLGHKMRRSAPGTFKSLGKNLEWLGWWQCAISFVIVVYYVVIIAWAFSFMSHSLNLAWGEDTKGFFFGNYLSLSDGPFSLNGLQVKVFIPLILVWIINYAVLMGGVKKGIEKANKIFMPILIILIIIIAIRGITLPGAAAGLDYLFKPDLSKIFNGRVWVAAYGQIFFSLSIAFGIMITYASYLPDDTDIVNNAFITSFANCGFSLLAGIAVFSILGYMAYLQSVPVAEVASAGVGLAFIVFPKAISALPGLNALFGILFFSSLVFAGLSSSISIIEVFSAGIMDKFDLTRKKALSWSCGVGFLVSIIFSTGAGLYILDIADHFINNYGVAFAGLVEAIILAWMFKLSDISDHINPISDFKVGKWWEICLKYITPALLGVMLILNVVQDVVNPYEGYPVPALLVMGVAVATLAIIAGFVVAKMKGSSPEFMAISPKGE
jgi:NSS family neurotransmitter:Na+ symporter